jgi:hypothetical protein
MNKYIQNAAVGSHQNPLTKNFSEWSKNTQQVTADAIINNENMGSKQSSYNPRPSLTGSNQGSAGMLGEQTSPFT